MKPKSLEIFIPGPAGRLEAKYYNFNGLNLSLETIDGLVKHNGPVNNQIKFNTILGKDFL